MKSLLAILAFFSSLAADAQTLQIGFPSGIPPYVFEDQRRGLDLEIVVAAAKHAGLKVKPFFAPRERLFRMIEDGQIDAIASANLGYEIKAEFSEPYIEFHNMAVALTSRHLDIKTIDDLKHYSITSFQRARSVLGPSFNAMASANPEYREEPRQVTRNMLLYSGRVDVAIADKRIFKYFNHEVAGKVNVAQPVTWYPIFPPTPYRVAFRRADYRDRFNTGLQKLRKSGEYDEIQKHYDSADY